MKFELLANELLLDLFEFLDAVHLLCAFSGLNARFNTLIFTHFRDYQLDFRFVSKSNFNNTCQNYLPIIIDQVISLQLSEDETPTLPTLFLSYGFTLDRFIHLKKLSLCHICSTDTLKELLIQCKHLSCLTHLNVIIYDTDQWEGSSSFIIDTIWGLPKLTHCNLKNVILDKIFLSGIDQDPATSSLIEFLSMTNCHCEFRALSYFLKRTPHLQRFCVRTAGSENIQLKTIVPKLISLNICFQGSSQSLLISLFQNMPNLSHLKIEIYDRYLNGYEWEKIFLNYLTKIKIFRMKMQFYFSNQSSKEEQMDKLLHSFQTHFWLEERQWFVRCDVNPPQYTSEVVILYTLPYTFGTFTYLNKCLSKSTCPNDKDYWLYDRVNILGCEQEDKYVLEKPIHYSPSFHNIHHLVTALPFNKNLLTCISSLNQLISLDVALTKDSAYSQLENLLNLAPHLNSLTLTSSCPIELTLFQMKNIAIRRLFFLRKNWKLYVSGMSTINFSRDIHVECDALISSPLRIQCEVLAIEVECRRNIVDLINAFVNLRLLIVKCKDDKRTRLEPQQINDELIDWLCYNLPSTCSVIREKRSRDILIWTG